MFGASGDGARFTPIFPGVTDRSGYFAGFVQQQRLTAAFAETGGGSTLVRHTIHITPQNWLPEPVLLFIDAPGKTSDEKNYGCTTPPPPTRGSEELAVHGEAFSTDLVVGCQDFTVPIRTLEEFEFFKIVRTTDPAIRGLTFPDTVRNELDLPQIASLLFDRGTLAQAVGASAIAVQTAAKPPRSYRYRLTSVETRLVRRGSRTMARLQQS